MILLDKPYVSDFLLKTIKTYKFPVIRTSVAEELAKDCDIKFISEKKVISEIKKTDDFLLYSNSENSIKWIEDHLGFTNLPEKIKLFKDKVAFRDLLKDIYPNYYYQKIEFNELENADISNIKFPVIIKPSIGFFSIGVHRIENASEWNTTIDTIKSEIELRKNLYPTEVINSADFIVEECIEGEEFAIDCYYDNQSKPVVLNILKHLFSSGKDMSDRLYLTSKEIIKSYILAFEGFLNKLGELANTKNFPVHVELRINEEGRIIPIEINPMRFGGWCTTADLAYHAFGHNLYNYYFSKQKPDWNELLKGKDNLIYSLVILDNNTGIEEKKIKQFNYDKLLAHFDKPLELRKINHLEFPLFGFLFCETKQKNMTELDSILKSDLQEYIQVK